MGELPMKRKASTGMPTRCETSIIGVTSLTTVRPATPGLTLSFELAIALHIFTTSSNARGELPGKPMSAPWIPISCMRCRISIFASTGGSTTLGFCRPSRSVSSRNVTPFGMRRPRLSTSFQS
jgi:hypothetical protein